MRLIRVQGTVYNLDQLVKFIEHTGQSESGVTEATLDPQPVFSPYRYIELLFTDGSRVELDGVQTAAFLADLTAGEPILDLDRVDEQALGRTLVRDAREGDVILPNEMMEEGRE